MTRRAIPLDNITNSMDINLSEAQKLVMDRKLVCYGPWSCKRRSDMTGDGTERTEQAEVNELKPIASERISQ